MKNQYQSPVILLEALNMCDVISTSSQLSPDIPPDIPQDGGENDGAWDM